MVFSSMIFLCVFLPVTLILHQILPGIRAKNTVLLVASLVFYAYGEPVYVLLLAASAFANYCFALLLGRFPGARKGLVFLSVAANLLVIGTFKYAGFLTEILNLLPGVSLPVPTVRMPLGISFFTFQAMSYVLDVARGKTEADRSFPRVLLYIVLFPQLIAGPIVQYRDVASTIKDRQVSLEDIAAGMRRFTAGLCKKVLVANTVGSTADLMFSLPAGEISAPAAWLGIISYLLQIYFDFSGYSDMAIGLGRMLGFHFRENFNYPYISGSIREFWKRWHISLTSWFREYVYIPLGGNRKGKIRTSLNRLLIFFLTGLWHGAAWNFVIWGLFHGAFMTLEECVPWIQKKGNAGKNLFRHVYTLLVVAVGFVIFRADSLPLAGAYIRAMFTGFPADRRILSLCLTQLTPRFLLTVVCGIIACTPVAARLKEKASMELPLYIASAAGLVLCIMSLAGSTYNPFIYFRF